VGLALAPACSWFEDPSPEEVRVSIDGPAGEQVQILMSKQFLTGVTDGGSTQVEIFDKNELVRTLPFDTIISIKREQRFFVRTVDADSISTQARMQVWIDGERKYDESQPVDQRQLLFLFTFNQPVTSLIELL